MLIRPSSLIAAAFVCLTLAAQAPLCPPPPPLPLPQVPAPTPLPPMPGPALAQRVPVLVRERDEVKTKTPIPGKPVRYVRIPTSSVRIDQKKPYLRVYYWPPLATEEGSAANAASPAATVKQDYSYGVVLDPIYFPYNESEFVAPSTNLAGITAWLKGDATNAVTLVGHADARGTKARNNRLSLERADAVKAALVQLGAPAQQILTKGAGSSMPVHKGKTKEANYWGSRRVEPHLHALEAGDKSGAAGKATVVATPTEATKSNRS